MAHVLDHVGVGCAFGLLGQRVAHEVQRLKRLTQVVVGRFQEPCLGRVRVFRGLHCLKAFLFALFDVGHVGGDQDESSVWQAVLVNQAPAPVAIELERLSRVMMLLQPVLDPCLFLSIGNVDGALADDLAQQFFEGVPGRQRAVLHVPPPGEPAVAGDEPVVGVEQRNAAMDMLDRVEELRLEPALLGIARQLSAMETEEQPNQTEHQEHHGQRNQRDEPHPLSPRRQYFVAPRADDDNQREILEHTVGQDPAQAIRRGDNVDRPGRTFRQGLGEQGGPWRRSFR